MPFFEVTVTFGNGVTQKGQVFADSADDIGLELAALYPPRAGESGSNDWSLGSFLIGASSTSQLPGLNVLASKAEGITGDQGPVLGPKGDVAAAETQLPFGAFLEGLRMRGAPTTGPLGDLARGQFGLAASAFPAAQSTGQIPGGTTFTGFAGSEGASGFRSTAAEAFKRILEGVAPESKFLQTLRNPAFFGETGEEPFRFGAAAQQGATLARARAGSQLSPFTVQALGPSNTRLAGEIQDALFRQQTGGVPEGEQPFQFMPFLQQRFGTGF